MLPGKKYRPEDVLRILKRRVWLVLVPFAMVSAGTAVVARKLPDRYRSDAVILVKPQQVPQDLVRSTVTAPLASRLPAIQQQVLSRTSLEQIITDNNLYPEERQTGIMQDVVDDMQRDISVQVARGDAIRVSFTAATPQTARDVTQKLVSLFIDQSEHDRATLANDTSQFLKSQVDNAESKLQETEQKLEAFRQKYQGELPTELDSNLQALQSTQLQIQALVDSLNRDRDQQLLAQRQLADLQDDTAAQDPSAAAVAPTIDPNDPAAGGGTTAQQLAAAKGALAALQLRYTADHPDVVRMKRIVADLQKKLDTEALTHPVGATPPPTPAEAARQRRIDGLQAQLAELQKRIADEQAKEKQLRDTAADLQQRIDKIPVRQSEMTDLMRDYSTQQNNYTSLLQRQQEAAIAANLESLQMGERFSPLDPAQLPQKPVSPNRPEINLFGMAGGLGVGLALVVLFEYRDTSFRTDEDVANTLSLPVLAVVPLMQSPRDHRRAIARRWFVTISLGGTVAGCLAVLIYTFVR
jgi:protein tyrosine kinase modulator